MQHNTDISLAHIKIEKHLENSADGCKNATLDLFLSMHTSYQSQLNSLESFVFLQFEQKTYKVDF